MSTLANKVRACDKFGSPVGLTYEGKKKHETIGGGLVSAVLKTLILVYLCLKMVAVFSYQDPQISIYEVMDSRKGM